MINIILSALLLGLSLIGFIFFLISNPAPAEKVPVSKCFTGTTGTIDGKKMCEAAQACKIQGGKLTSYKNTFSNGPEFECEY